MSFRAYTFALLIFCLGPISAALAKPPTLDTLFPAGAQRGQTVEVTAGGSLDPWPVQVWVDGQGLTVEPAEEKGKLSVTVAPDAPLGVAWLRLYNDEVASALRPLVIGGLPEIVETEPNDSPTAPQTIEGSAVTINGRLEKTGDVDSFAVTLETGQQLVASLVANRLLGSPMDGILQVATPAGFVLAHVDDAPGLDPRIIFDAPATGTYIVRTFAFPAEPSSAIRFAGGGNFIYRLTLTTGPFADHAYPLAVSRDDPGTVEIHGWNLPDEIRSLPVLLDPATPDRARVDHPTLPGAPEVALVPHAALVEQESADIDQPQPFPFPASLTGRIDPPGDRDAFQFDARKGDRRLLRVVSRSLDFPLDPVLRVLDDAGKVVAEADDAPRDGRDAELLFTAPGDGTYRVVVRDLNDQGGPRHVYRLDIVAPEPDYRLTLESDRFTLTPGKPLEIPVTIERQNGFDRPIRLAAEGLPPGVEAAPAESQPKGDSAKKVTLTLTAKEPPRWSGPFRIVGQVPDASDLKRSAESPLDGLDHATDRPWLTLLGTAPPEAQPADGDS